MEPEYHSLEHEAVPQMRVGETAAVPPLSGVVVSPEPSAPGSVEASIVPGAAAMMPSQVVALPEEPAMPPAPPAPKSSKLPPLRFHRRAFGITIGLVSLMLLAGLAGFYLVGSKPPKTDTAAAGNFGVSSLQGVNRASPLNLGQPHQLEVNGRLVVKQGLVIAPSGVPNNALIGQLYLNANDRQLYYFDGAQFTALVTDERLAALSAQQRPPLGAGRGLALNGTTLTNTGVTSVAGTAGQIIVSANSGDVSLRLPDFSAGSLLYGGGSGAPLGGIAPVAAGQCLLSNGVNAAPGFQACPGIDSVADGTAGQLAVFDAAHHLSNSIISQSGTVITVQGDLTATGILTGNGSGLSNLNATALATGKVADARLSANVALRDAAQTFSAPNTFSALLTAAGSLQAGVTNSSTGQLRLAAAGSSFLGSLQVTNLAQATTYTLPDPGTASVNVCLSTGNCAGAGGGITGSGTAGRLSKFTASGTIGDSTLSEAGTTLTASGNLVIQGSNSLAVGTASTANGSLKFYNALGSRAVTLQAPASDPASDLVFKLPSAYGSNGNCLISDGAGGLAFSACTGGAGGGVTSLNSQTGVVTLSNASGSAGTITIDNASTSAKGIAQFNGTNFSVTAGAVNTIQDIATTANPTFSAQTLQGNTTALILSGTPTASATSSLIQVGAVIAGGNSALNGGTYIGLNAPATGSGSAADFINLQVNGASKLKVTNAGDLAVAGTYNGQTISSAASFTGTLAVATLGTAGSTPICLNASSQLGSCSTNAATVTLQQAYDVSANPELVVDATRGALTIRDASTPIGANLLEVQNNAGTTNYLAVSATGATVTGNLTVSGIVTTNTLFTGSRAAGNDILNFTVPGDATSRFVSDISGKFNWGDGTNPRDTNLYRSAAQQLSTGGQIRAALGFVAYPGTVGQAFIGDIGGARGGILLGSTSDTSLYRSAASTLKTDSNFVGAGTALFQNATDSTTAFQVQNAAGTSNLFVANTANSIVGIAKIPSVGGAKLQVGGNFDATGSATLGADLTARNNTASQVKIGQVGPASEAGISFSNSSPARLYSSAANTLKTDSYLTQQNAANSTTAFQIQNAGGGQVLTADTTTNSLIVNQGNLTVANLATPGAPTVTPTGTAGSTTYTYYIVAKNANGATVPGPAGSTTTGNATLSATNYNAITWTAVPNATSYDVLKTNTSTLLGSTTTTSLNDTGQATSAYTPNTSNTTGGSLTVQSGATINTGGASGIGLVVKGAASQTADLLQVQDSAGSVLARVGPTGDIASQNDTGVLLGESNAASLGFYNLFKTNNASRSAVVVRGAAAQTADLLQLQNSAGTVLSKFDSAGNLNIAPASSRATINLDTQTGNTSGPIINFKKQGTSEFSIYDYTGSAKLAFFDNSTNTDALFIQGGNTSITGILNANATGKTAITIADSGAQNSGLTIGGDTNLYRLAAGSLKTDGSLTVGSSLTVQGPNIIFNNASAALIMQGAAAGTDQIFLGGSGESAYRFRLSNSGLLSWGSGSAVADTNLYRLAAGVLQSDGILNAGGNLRAAYNTANQVNIGNIGVGTGGLSFGSAGDTNLYRSATGTLRTDSNLVGTGTALFQNTANSTTAFQVQNAAGVQLINVDTTHPSSNLVTNGSFEVDTAGWAGKGSGTIARSTAQKYIGNASGLVSTTATAGDGASYAVTLSPSTQYTLSVFVRDGGSFGPNLSLGRQDVSGTDIDCLTGRNPSSSGFIRYNCTFTTGATITSSNLYVKQSDATARSFYIDAISLATGSGYVPYSEGAISLNGTVTSPLVIQGQADSTSAFQVQQLQNSNLSVFNVDSMNNTVSIGSNQAYTSAKLLVSTGSYPVIVANATGSNNLLQLQKAGSNVVTVASTGATTLKNSADSTTAFQIQNAAGTQVLTVDTQNTRIGIGTATPAYTLDVVGSINASGKVKEKGNDLLPAGSMMMFMGTTSPPAGWLLCDGSAVSRTAYSDLFTVFGTTYGVGDGSTTFNLPDCRGRVLVGLGTNTEVNALTNNDGLAVGSRKVKHRHGIGTLSIGNHQITTMYGGTLGILDNNDRPANMYGGTLRDAGANIYGHSISGEAGDTTGPLDGPAYQVVNYIIKY